MEFYRSTAVGNALIQSMNELLATEELSNEEALEILNVFDEKFTILLRENVVIDKYTLTNEGSGTLANYNNFEDLWKIDTEDLELKLGSPELSALKYHRARILFTNPVPLSVPLKADNADHSTTKLDS